MTSLVPLTRPDLEPPPAESDQASLAVERLKAEGWPVLRGTALQRDTRFVKKLLKAQLALVRGGR